MTVRTQAVFSANPNVDWLPSARAVYDMLRTGTCAQALYAGPWGLSSVQQVTFPYLVTRVGASWVWARLIVFRCCASYSIIYMRTKCSTVTSIATVEYWPEPIRPWLNGAWPQFQPCTERPQLQLADRCPGQQPCCASASYGRCALSGSLTEITLKGRMHVGMSALPTNTFNYSHAACSLRLTSLRSSLC